MRKEERASISIEALIAMTLFLLTTFYLFGMFYSLYVDSNIQWCMSETVDEIALIPMEFNLSSASYDLLLRQRLISKVKTKGLETFVEINHTFRSKKILSDTLLWKVKYTYRFLGLKKSDIWIVPIKLSPKGDQMDYKDDLVFVTNYGEKYHHLECRYLWKSRFLRKKEDAIQSKYTPCKVCQ